MSLTDNQLKALWIKRNGNKAWAKDCYGAWIYFYDRGRDCSPRVNPDGVKEPCGWEIDHIYPEAKGGRDDESNLEIVYGGFNGMKSDELNYKLTGDTVFKVMKRYYKGGYGIYDTKRQKFIDWVSNH